MGWSSRPEQTKPMLVMMSSLPPTQGSLATNPSSENMAFYYKRVDYVEYSTNLYFVPTPTEVHLSDAWNEIILTKQSHFHTDLRPRSSISSKTNFVLANSIGLIDRGYHNQVLVRFKYVWQPEDFEICGAADSIKGVPNVNRMYKMGDAIAQILPSRTFDIEFDLVDELPGENRGGGFGSTDAKR